MKYTKKHFELWATRIGHYSKCADTMDGSSEDYRAGVTDVISMLETDCIVDFNKSNPAFDANRFHAWINDVREGRRDEFTGKRIK